MADYKNKQELQNAINEGYFKVNSYEKISPKGLLLEKVLNMAKNNNDEMFKKLSILAEEALEDEKELEQSLDVDSFIKQSNREEDKQSAVIDNLPMTTLAIKKLDVSDIETLKWLVAKKADKVIDKNKIFELTDAQFKKLVCDLLREEDKVEELKQNEKEFTDNAIETNTVEPLVENFIKYVGLPINEEMEIPADEDNEYYYLVKKQIDTLGDEEIKERIPESMEVVNLDSTGKDAFDLIEEVPAEIQMDVQKAYVKDMIKSGDFEMDDTEVDDLTDMEEDEEFAEIIARDEELDTKELTFDEQIERQENLIEELKQLYIIKGTRDRIMLESSHVLRDISSKKKLLTRVLLYEETKDNKDKKGYCEKLIKINTLVECLVRKYLPVILEG